ncbi:MAG: V-type ATP synthase subunit B, partial [Acidilobaceae archaeon]
MAVIGVREYARISEVKGPLLVVEGVSRVAYDEIVEVELSNGEKRRGKVLEVAYNTAIVQVLEGTTGITLTGTTVRFLGKTLEMPVSDDMLGRIFNSLGEPVDVGPPIVPE